MEPTLVSSAQPIDAGDGETVHHPASMQHIYAGTSHSPQQQQSMNDRPFKCDQCVHSFNRNHDLKRHKRIHLDVKPYPCGHCGMSFTRKDALKRHILVKGCGKSGSSDCSDEAERSIAISPGTTNVGSLESHAELGIVEGLLRNALVIMLHFKDSFASPRYPRTRNYAKTAQTKNTPEQKLFGDCLSKLVMWAEICPAGFLDEILDGATKLRTSLLDLTLDLSRLLLKRSNSLHADSLKTSLHSDQASLRRYIEAATHLSEEYDSDWDDDDRKSDTNLSGNFENSVLSSEDLEDISCTINCLRELSPSLEVAKTNFEQRKLEKAKSEPPNCSSPSTAKEAWSYAGLILDQFPNADKILVDKLAQANLTRSLQLRRQMEEQSSRNAAPVVAMPNEVLSIFAPVSAFHDSGLGSSIPQASNYAESLSSTLSQVQGSSFRVPNVPEGVSYGDEFTCPYCLKTLSHIKNRSVWKEHVFCDLRPYTCFASSCDKEPKFSSREEWIFHLRTHAIARQNYGKRSFEFLSSLYEYGICRAARSSPSSVQSGAVCNLCQENIEASAFQVLQHVAKHLESISLACLPRNVGSDVASDEESDVARNHELDTNRQTSIERHGIHWRLSPFSNASTLKNLKSVSK